jgi:hypothetical protein
MTRLVKLEARVVFIRGRERDQIQLSTDVEQGGALGSSVSCSQSRVFPGPEPEPGL